MAKTANFGALLDLAPSEVERPKPMPEGSYLWVVQGQPEYGKSSKKQTEFVSFTLKCLQAGPDVDQTELDNMGGIEDKTTKAVFYLTEGSLYRLKDFLLDCGIEEAKTIQNMVDQAMNCQVGGYIRHEPSNDGESFFARLGKTFPAEEFGEEAEAA